MAMHVRHPARAESQVTRFRVTQWMPAVAGAIAFLLAGAVRAEMPAYKLSLLPEDESVYAPPSAPREDQGINLGGVNLDLKISYLTDDFYRGIDDSRFTSRPTNLNIQCYTPISFNTG